MKPMTHAQQERLDAARRDYELAVARAHETIIDPARKDWLAVVDQIDRENGAAEDMQRALE